MTVTALNARTALVLVDLQNGILGVPTARPIPDVIANAARLATAVRARDLHVVLVRVLPPFGADALDGHVDRPRPAGDLPAGFADIVPELAGHEGDLVVTKRQWGAFYGTDLDTRLRRRGVTGIVMGGVATAFGVDTTARNAYERGYRLTFATDAMSDAAESHEFCVNTVFPRIGQTGTSDEILAKLAD
jgi:nicotinamidase-related amidase